VTTPEFSQNKVSDHGRVQLTRDSFCFGDQEGEEARKVKKGGEKQSRDEVAGPQIRIFQLSDVVVPGVYRS